LAKVGNDITGEKQKRDEANFLIFVVFPFPFKLFAFSACAARPVSSLTPQFRRATMREVVKLRFFGEKC